MQLNCRRSPTSIDTVFRVATFPSNTLDTVIYGRNGKKSALACEIGSHVQTDTLCHSARSRDWNWRSIQAASTVAASMSKMGMPSWIGYTRRHPLHFRLGGFSRNASACLQAGQTRMSSRSCGIMISHSNREIVVGRWPLVVRPSLFARWSGCVARWSRSWVAKDERPTTNDAPHP
jgi:hypothetical protein